MVVCDSEPLIHLSRAGQIELFRKIFESVEIPTSVYRETVEEAKAFKKLGVAVIENAIDEGWVRVIELSRPEADLVKKLARSESITVEDAEVVYLAKKESTTSVTNDKWLMKVADSLGIKVMWTTTVILLAVKNKLITKSMGRNVLNYPGLKP